MRKGKIYKYLVLAVSCTLCGCVGASPLAGAGLVGGLLGSGVGAGAGALVGDNIKNGDVKNSAILGAGIGLAAGAAIGVGYKAYSQQNEINNNLDQINSNHDHLVQNEAEMADLRDSMAAESSEMDVDRTQSEHLYVGPSMGAYNR